MKTQALAIDLLRIDGGTQNRVAIDGDTVEDYATLISENGTDWPFPPLDVFHDGSEYFVADGFHRLLGGKRAKRGSIPCKVHTGTAADAKIFGMTANDRHGLRMTRADKHACVEWLLDHGGKMTQEEIASKSGVTTRTVRIIVADRKSKLSESSRKTSGSNAQTGKSGKTPDTPAGGPGHGAETQHQAGESRDAHPSAGASEEPFAGEEGWVSAEELAEATGDGKGKPKTPPKQLDRSAWYKQWDQSIGPLVRLVDKIASAVGESKCESHKVVQEHLNIATEEMMEWMGVKK